MRSAQQCTNVLFLASFIDTVLRSAFSYLKSDTCVIAVRKRRRKTKSGEPQSKKASSPAPTAKTRKRKPAKTSRNGKTTTVQADNPKDTVFELVAQVPGQVKIASKPRKNKATQSRSNTEQRTLPELPASGEESKA